MSAIWIKNLNESDSRLHKEDVLRKVLSAATLGDYDSQVFLSLVNAAYNPMITWGIKKVPDTMGIVDAENPWAEFSDLLNQLRLRNLTGNSARDAVDAMSKRFNSDDWNLFCAAVLRKDLRAGISDKTINKVCKGTKYEVPVFSCQLATSCEDRPEMSGVKRLEPKLDGVRVLMMCIIGQDSTIVTSYSRNGKIFENFSHIELELEDVIHRIAGLSGHTSFILDGEVVGNSFQELMRQARRKENAQADDSVFHVFDFIPLDDFVRGSCNMPLKRRLMILEKIRGVLGQLSSVALLPSIEVNLDTALGREQLDRYANDQVSAGFEGIMVKNLDAPYECKRNTFWLKWKPVITVDLEIVSVEEGTGRNAGRLGALVCSGVDNDKSITVNVGSGFSDADRDNYWVNSSVVIGRTAEIMCDAITQNQNGTYSLRFPRFVRFREDK